ncbi:pirin family protein [Stratiformator vulcanicus]|uniref:Quercetin 2,3-dioxygenase n=1 Tax=Stratiformator vulcanicus TaxID=2527980 RepID=A0A517R5A5_9PLAN|nr:pirin family protein [Stratiformator vulcanicus]QDT39077.1 Quercetin 2,3-dioxygenase [Stratiformator vulcanicus]
MLTVRKSNDRGYFDHGWLKTFHTFSFSGYQDPRYMGFRSLRVINEDVIEAGGGFGEHPHRDMEIITYVTGGVLAHKDSTGGGGELRRGDVQVMTAGSGLTHSEFNGSKEKPAKLLQIWIKPAEKGIAPRYQQTHFEEKQKRNRLQPIASPDERGGSLPIGQDAIVSATILEPEEELSVDLAPDRHAWIQVVDGSATVNGTAINTGDGLAVSEESHLQIATEQGAELLVFDLA